MTQQRIAPSSYRHVITRHGDEYDVAFFTSLTMPNGTVEPIAIIERFHSDYLAIHPPTQTYIKACTTLEQVLASLSMDSIYGYSHMLAQRIFDYRELHHPFLQAPRGRLILDWQHRERTRFEIGEYHAIPDIGVQFDTSHFIHRSVDKDHADFIAFTPSEEYGLADRQTRMRLGRYLKRYHPDLSDATIAQKVELFKAILARESAPYELHFTTEAHVIDDIFETPMYARDSSCLSCMYNKFTDWGHRPYHVYADSPDVAVAYLTKGDEIVARTVVDSCSKAWIRPYSIRSNDSTLCNVLIEMLEEAGYDEGNLIGCRLTVQPSIHRQTILPYIDHGGMYVYRDGRYWIVCEDEDDADYCGDNTNGYATELGPKCSHCDRRGDNCDCSICSHCGGNQDAGDCDCSYCPRCSENVDAGDCDCERCSSCDDLIRDCECDRCECCNALEDDCECEEEEEENEEEETYVTQDTPNHAHV